MLLRWQGTVVLKCVFPALCHSHTELPLLTPSVLNPVGTQTMSSLPSLLAIQRQQGTCLPDPSAPAFLLIWSFPWQCSSKCSRLQGTGKLQFPREWVWRLSILNNKVIRFGVCRRISREELTKKRIFLFLYVHPPLTARKCKENVLSKPSKCLVPIFFFLSSTTCNSTLKLTSKPGGSQGRCKKVIWQVVSAALAEVTLFLDEGLLNSLRTGKPQNC